MLSIKPISSAKSACDYYMQTLDYYKSDATAIAWLGNGLKYLHLPEKIDENTFLNLLQGILPNGQKLQNPQGEHRPGFDMTFSAPKSVSVLVGLDVAPDLVKFHDDAVKFAINQIEKEFTETRVRQNDDIRFVKTDNLVIASFRQPSSRANDPALHTHCVTMNMTFLDSKARSLASDTSRTRGVVEQIQNNAHYCGLLYRQNLANNLKEAGFKLRLTGNGLFEIDGVPEEVLKEFSKRREDIENLMNEKGWSGAKSAAHATLITRSGKEEHDLKVLQDNWQKRANSLSFDAKEFVNNKPDNNLLHKIKQKALSLFEKPEIDYIKKAESCVKVAVETLSQKESVFSKRALITESLKHSLISDNVIQYQDILDAIENEISSQNLYQAACDYTGQTLLTTPWLLTLETETIARIENNKDMVLPIATQKEVLKYQKERAPTLEYPLTPSQKEAMRILLTSKDRFLAIQGYAGVAKTTMLKEASLLIKDKGYNLRGIAVSSSAVNEMQTKGDIKSDVFPIIYQELKDAKSGSLEKTIYIADEASMLSSPQGHALIKHIERTQSRLILVGDRAQLPSVNNGRIFGLIQEHGIKTATMYEIVRQKNAELKEAVISVTKGNIKEAIEKLDIKELVNHEERINWIAKFWLEKPQDTRHKTLIFAPTNKDRIAITDVIREGLKQENLLQGEKYQQIILKAKAFEAIQQRFVSYYQKDDVIRFNQSYKNHLIKHGNYYTVGAILPKHRKNNLLPIINQQGKIITFPLKMLPQYKTHTAAFERIIEVYKKDLIELQVGDKLMWLRNSKSFGIRNGDTFELQEISKNNLIFKTNSSEKLILDKNNHALKHLDYGYVLTNYKVQGKDANYAIGLMESYNKFGSTIKNFYVQISRAIHGMTLITDDKDQLTKAIINNKYEKQAALDIISNQDLGLGKTQPSKELEK